MADERLERIRRAYAEAETEQPALTHPARMGPISSLAGPVYIVGHLDDQHRNL